jgi:hypothetical protein
MRKKLLKVEVYRQIFFTRFEYFFQITVYRYNSMCFYTPEMATCCKVNSRQLNMATGPIIFLNPRF